MGKPGGRWKKAVWMSAVDLLQKLDWKVAARREEFGGRGSGNAIEEK